MWKPFPRHALFFFLAVGWSQLRCPSLLGLSWPGLSESIAQVWPRGAVSAGAGDDACSCLCPLSSAAPLSWGSLHAAPAAAPSTSSSPRDLQRRHRPLGKVALACSLSEKKWDCCLGCLPQIPGVSLFWGVLLWPPACWPQRSSGPALLALSCI